MSSLRTSQSGLSQIGLLLTVLIGGALFYAGIQVVPFYVRYFELEGHFEAQADKANMKSDDEIRNFLAEQVRKMDLPLEPHEIIVRRQGQSIIIETKYEETLVFDFGEEYYYELWTFKFHPKIEKKYT